MSRGPENHPQRARVPKIRETVKEFIGDKLPRGSVLGRRVAEGATTIRHSVKEVALVTGITVTVFAAQTRIDFGKRAKDMGLDDIVEALVEAGLSPDKAQKQAVLDNIGGSQTPPVIDTPDLGPEGKQKL